MKRLVVYDEPVAKARPRVTVQNGKARAYTPRKTQDSEWRIRTAWIAEHGDQAATGALYVSVDVFVPMPKSIPKSRRATALPTTRPDADNYVKVVLDALQGVAFVDDSSVVDVEISKRYALAGPPHWDIEVGEALP